MKRIAVMGDYNENIVAHRAIPIALQMVVSTLKVDVQWDWLPTDTLTAPIDEQLKAYSALWCAPGTRIEMHGAQLKRYVMRALISFHFSAPAVAFNTP